MLKTMVIDKKKLVIMYIMCNIAVFDSNAVCFLNTTVGCCFAAICKATEYCIVSESNAIINISICQICCLRIIFLFIVSVIFFSAIISLILRLKSLNLFSIIFFNDAFMAVFFNMIYESAIIV